MMMHFFAEDSTKVEAFSLETEATFHNETEGSENESERLADDVSANISKDFDKHLRSAEANLADLELDFFRYAFRAVANELNDLVDHSLASSCTKSRSLRLLLRAQGFPAFQVAQAETHLRSHLSTLICSKLRLISLSSSDSTACLKTCTNPSTLKSASGDLSTESRSLAAYQRCCRCSLSQSCWLCLL